MQHWARLWLQASCYMCAEGITDGWDISSHCDLVYSTLADGLSCGKAV